MYLQHFLNHDGESAHNSRYIIGGFGRQLVSVIPSGICYGCRLENSERTISIIFTVITFVLEIRIASVIRIYSYKALPKKNLGLHNIVIY